MTLLSVSSLAVSLGASPVLDGINWSIGPGEVVGIQGESGSGKSTFLHTLAGLLTPDAGEVVLGDQRIDNLPDRKRASVRLRRFGFILQSGDLLPELTISQNVALPLRLLGVRGVDVIERTRSILNDVGIEELADRSLSEVSGGQLQRAAIARALIHDPEVILADEPTGSLDPATAQHVLGLLMALSRGNSSSLVIVTHDAAVASQCDRVHHLRGTRFEQQLRTSRTLVE